MSQYPNYLSDPQVTQHEGFEILIRTSTHTWGHALGEISGMFEIIKDGERLAISSVAGTFQTAVEAAANALRIAKDVISERLDAADS